MRKLLRCFITCNFLYIFWANAQVPQRFDLVIDEIFADPDPTVGLPNVEFTEIRNRSGKNINLQGWRLSSLSTRSTPFPVYQLPADSFLIITSTSNTAALTMYGKVLGVSSFPSLTNSGTLLTLTSKEGITIHSVDFKSNWFQNDIKSNGGWSLEMIDSNNPCTGMANWKASQDPRGGTPGAKNSVDANNPDKIAPALVAAATLDSMTVELTFSEPVDSAIAAIATNYIISEGINALVSASPLAPSFTNVRLTLSVPLKERKVYTVTANNIADCAGNIIQAIKTTKLGLPVLVDTLDMVINEILFNPKPPGVDYVEIYNRSNKIFNLKDLYLASRSSSTSVITTPRRLSADNKLLFPGDFYVISEDGAVVKQNYYAKNPDNFVDISMPPFPDDKGTVVLLNAQGQVIDELAYSSSWHFALISNDEGIALERNDYNKDTQNKNNWTSAAATAGFGTPSFQNSQFRNDVLAAGSVTITPKTFSPDNDGFDDYTTVNVQMSEPGYVTNITIFDAAGRAIKELVRNATLAATSSFKWEGLDDKLRKVPVGVYVMYTEAFSLNGKKKSFKNTVVVGAKF